MGEVRHTYRARRDLIELWLELRDINPGAADRVYERLGLGLKSSSSFPEAGPLRPRLDREARVLVEPPYLILYRIVPEGVQIVRVVHGARQIDRALFLRGLE